MERIADALRRWPGWLMPRRGTGATRVERHGAPAARPHTSWCSCGAPLRPDDAQQCLDCVEARFF